MISRRFRLLTALCALALAALVQGPGGPVQAQTGCAAAANPVLCENAKPGAPASEWDVSGAGDTDLQGFATDISVTRGDTQRFKIDTTAASVTIDIYRMGYYDGMGARRIGSVTPVTATNQPNCLNNATTGLIDCGNWSVSASWIVPADAVSGIYFARLRRSDTGGSSHIVFVVRDDTGRSDLLFQTSDTTWQAYNSYGGNSLYQGSPVGRAYKVSYNRPFNTRGTAPQDWVFNAEYPMVRFLEANGYDVSYTSGIDSDRRGAELLEHKVFVSVGHDEYWSGAQRTNVEAARGAGVHLAFFSGNEVFWKTRWESSIDASATPYRTLVAYKETHAGAKIDPSPEWTGTWRDPRFSPPANGGRPENALTGTSFEVNAGTSAIRVPAANGKMRFWRNTSVANLATGAVATLAANTLGYEWDEAPDDAFTPTGLMRLSLTTVDAEILLDYGSTYGFGPATHSLTMYRHASGALVFGAGTIQWTWGLDDTHDRGSAPADVRMQQATVNLFADMSAQPDSLQPGLTAATPSLDTLAPATTITSPLAGQSVVAGTPIVISGTATDPDGGVVGGVEVSVDGGTTWKRATGTTTWSYNWTPSGTGTATIRSRAFDDTGNMETPSSGVTVTVAGGGGACPCTIWAPTAVPPDPDDDDTAAIELGTKFRADTDGFITGVRFYKAVLNTGTHTGKLWTRTGTLLGSVTFTNETSSGWQQATFATPIAITANTTYVVSYHAPNGHYTGTDDFFVNSLDRPPLHGLSDGADGANGLYRYGTSAFPNSTYLSEGYWVDVVYTQSIGPDTTPPTITATSPANGAGGVSIAAAVTATFSEAMNAATIFAAVQGGEGGGTPGTFELRDSLSTLVPAVVTYDAATRTATLRPNQLLALSTTYTVLVRGSSVDPRVKDQAGNAMAANAGWSFTTSATPPPPPPPPPTCPCSIWAPTATPPILDDLDPDAIELGTRFRSDVNGFITGVRFYKAAANTGTHTGKLWTNAGALLGTVTFSGETASGWQQASFATPIAITANTTYVVSYFAPNGHYSGTDRQFALAGVDNGPLHALRDGVDGLNGVYRYGPSSFPNESFESEGYWADVVFVTNFGPDTTPPGISAVTPVNNASGVSTGVNLTVAFNEAMTSSTINSSTILLRDPSNALVPAAVTYDSTTRVATLNPTALLATSTRYTATIKGGLVDPRVKDAVGNAMASDYTWSFTIAAPPPPPPTQGPGGPVLVVTSTTNLFSTYYAEILRNEGLNAFATLDLSQVSAATLSGYDAVILGEMPLTAAQVTMFSNWVTAGGNLVAMRPDKQLAGLLGLTDAGTTLANAYLLVSTAAAPGAGIVNQTMQFHGTADRYTLGSATSLATLYSTATAATSNPAVTMRQVGAGRAVAFTYDLARSVVYTRQGNPAWSGQERDGVAPIRSDDLFFGARTGDVQPDWVNLAKVAIPQADEQQRFLWNILLNINANKKPLPRFWYFPRMLKAAVIMTGDDHANNGTAERFDGYMASSTPGCSVDDWACIRATSYIFTGTPITDAAAANYAALGFEIALHVNTNCADYTPATLPQFFSTQLAQFASSWPSVPTPTTNRTHCITFSDYSTQPQVELSNGIRFDTNYYYWPGTWVNDRPGLFTGSGLPMRFATATGQMIDVYQSATQITDESAQTYQTHIDALLDRAIGAEGYYVAVDANMHTDFNPSEGSIGSDIIVASAQARGIPVVSATQMLTWLDGRNGSSFQSITWGNKLLGFTIAVGAGANGLHAMVPASAGGSGITGITTNGTPVPYTTQTIKGVSYAVFAAQSGPHQVSYGADLIAPVISNLAASGTGSTATVQWDTNEASSSQVVYGTSPTALTLTINDPALVTTHSLTLPGLATGTTYYYRVSSTDAATNLATSPAPPAAPASFATTTPLVSIADVSVTEGNSGTVAAAFVVTMSSSSTQTVTVNYAASAGTAGMAGDFAPASGTVTFAPGETTRTINVLVNGETVYEPNETFNVTLSGPVNVQLADAVAVGTILNDDGVPSITISDPSVTEGNSGVTNAVFTVTLSNPSESSLTVNFATGSGTAVADQDFVTTSGSLTFTAGVTTQLISVPVLGDALNEADEQFTVALSGAVNASIADAQGTGLIGNDDPAPSITIADVSLTEGNSGTKVAAFALTLSSVSGQAVAVTYATANGTATAGSDYVAASGTATFAAGATAAVVNVTVNGDALVELNEAFVVNLSAPANATLARAQATGLITNDDVPSLSVADVTVTEGNTGTVTANFVVTMTTASPQVVTASYATSNGSATAGSDFTTSSGTVTFAASETSRSIAVPVTGDTVTETTETFTLTLSTPVNGTLADAVAIGTIVNDDAVPSITIADVSVTEGNAGQSNAVFTVALSNASTATVTVDFATATGTAAAGADYITVTPGTLSFVPGVTAQTVNVPVLGDALNEADEQFTVNLSGAVNASIGDAQATGLILNDDAAPSITIADVSVTEGNSGTKVAAFALTLSSASGQPITVAYATANGTATAGSDYVAASGTASFAAGATTTVVNVTVNGDALVESDETFAVNLSAPTNGTLARAQATGLITNDDVPSLSVADVTVTEGNAGTVAANFVVTMTAASTQTVSIDYATSNGSATAGSDYATTSGTATFAPGETSTSVAVLVTGDTLTEGDEAFTLTLSNVVNGQLADAVATGAIVNDDAVPAITIADVSVTEGNAGQSNAVLTVTLSNASDATVTVNFATAAGTAVAGADFVATPGTLSFAPGVTTHAVNVAVVGDVLNEADEQFTVNLTGAVNASIGDAQGTGLIVNDDAVPSITVADVSVTEGNSGTKVAAFALTLSGASGQPVSVAYTTADGTATAGSDYVAISGTASFAAGATTAVVNVTVNGDALVEANEAFVVSLSASINATLARAQAAGLITNDDVPSLSVADATVTEGNAGTVTAGFVVTMTAASTQTVSVDYATSNGSATAGADYSAASGTLTFAPGQTSQSIAVLVTGDTVTEGDEAFALTLSNVVNGQLADAVATGAIVNDDAVPSIAIADVSVTEGNAGQSNAVFTVTLSNASNATVTIDFATTAGTAVAGADFVTTPGTLSFAPGVTTQTITVPVVGDALNEADEQFTVNLTGAVNGTIGDAQGVGVILNDDAAPAITIADVSVTEGNSGTKVAAFALTLSAASGQPVTAAYTTANGTATAGSDYVAINGTVSFAAGATTAVVNVTVNGDAGVEPDEAFVVNLSAPTNATLARAQATGLITNDDVPSVSVADVTVTEGNAGTVAANFVVTMTAASTQVVTASYATSNGSATAGSDFATASGSVTFAAGQTSRSITVLVTGDIVRETDETFTVTLSNPVNAQLADAVAAGTIVNDDAVPSLTIADMSVTEGNAGAVAGSFVVTMTGASTETVSIDYATSNGSATAGSDYAAASGTLSFAPGDTTKSIAVLVTGDTLTEGDEAFTLTLSNVLNGQLADAVATGAIVNDDAVPAITIADVSVTEGNAGQSNAAFTVALSNASDATVTIDFAATAGTAVAGADFVATPGTLSFAPGVTTQTINVAVVGDALNEADEQFTVNLTGAVNASIGDEQGVGVIANDDPAPSVSIADVTLIEGNSGTRIAAFALTLSNASGQPVTVAYTTADGSAAAGSDYVATTGTATFAAGSTTAVVNVTVNGDGAVEPDEAFVVNLSAPTNATLARAQATGLITNDDVPSVSVADVTVTEGNAGTVSANFAVTMTAASTQVVTASYATSNGSATAGSDFATLSGSVTFAPGETSKSIAVLVTGDTLTEGDETFTLTLSNPVNGQLADAVAVGTIANDDAVPSITIADVSVTESNAGQSNAVFTVTLSTASASSITVNFATAGGTAVAGQDFVTTSGVLTFAPGVTTQSISVPVLGDLLNEADEQFSVGLTGAANASIGDAQGTGLIVNDDPTPAISIADVSLTEGNSGTKVAAFALTLSAASGQAVSVAYNTADATATAGSDYVAASGTATFAAGATAAVINVVVNGDGLSEPDESFVVNLTNPTNATLARVQANGTITNDEGVPTLSISDVTITEGNAGTVNAVVSVTLVPASSQPVSVSYATANATATAGSDYTAATGTLSFAPGVPSQVLTLVITGDAVDEPNETLLVDLSSPVNALVGDGQGVVTITDDDPTPGVPVGLVAAYGFGEGSGTTIADTSGNGNSGTIAGATWSPEGRTGNALSFDGVNDMVTVADKPSLDVTRITMMAWVRPTTLSGWRTALLKETTTGLAYALYAHDQSPRPAGYVNTGGTDRPAEGTAAIPLNTWTHLTTTYDGANIRLYVDGVLVRTRAVTGNIAVSARALRIGGNSIWGEYFAGLIDDVRIYNRALALTEIQADMNTPVTP